MTAARGLRRGPDGDHLAFVSDRDGISNLYIQDLRSDRLFRLTNLTTGVIERVSVSSAGAVLDSAVPLPM